jgi:hypothetical protein
MFKMIVWFVKQKSKSFYTYIFLNQMLTVIHLIFFFMKSTLFPRNISQNNNFFHKAKYKDLFFRKCLFAMMIMIGILMSGLVSGQTTVNIYPADLTFSSGYVTSAGTKYSGDMQVSTNTTYGRGWIKFPLSSLPSNAIISDVTISFYFYTGATSSAQNTIRGFYGDPVTMAGTTLYNDIGAGTSYNSSTWDINTWNVRVLSGAESYVQNAISTGYVNFGFFRGSSNLHGIYGYTNATYKPYITVTYTVPSCSGTPNGGTATVDGTTSVTVCAGSQVELQATGYSHSMLGLSSIWQSSSTSGGPWSDISGAVSDTYVTTVSTDTYFRYYTTCSNSGLSAATNEVSVTATVIQAPTVSNEVIVCGETATLSASGSPDGYIWFEDAAGTIQIGTGSDIDVSPAVTTTYYVASSYGSQSNSYGESFDAMSLPAGWSNSNNQSDVSANAFWKFSPTGIDYGMAGTTDHTGNGGTFAWVDGSSPYPIIVTLTSPLYPQESYTDLTFFMKRNTTGYDTNPMNTFTLDFYDGSTWHNAVFTHTSNTASGNWEQFIVPLNSFTITGQVQYRINVNKNGAITYYDDIAVDDFQLNSGGSYCLSALVPVLVTVNSIPDPTASDVTINCGETATLTASGSPADYTWYSDAGGTTVVATGSVFTTPLLATDMTYYVASTYAGMCVSNLIPVTVTVIPLYDPVATDATINCGETATLTASGSQAGYTWYSDAAGTQVVGTGSPFTTPVLADNTTYYVASTSGGLCISNLVPSVVTVTPLPEPVVSDTSAYCGVTTTLTATGSPLDYIWFEDAAGTVVLGTGPTLDVIPVSTATYYVASTGGQSTGQTYTFTNCGATGRFGPTQSQLDNTYSGTNLDGLVTIFTQGIQQWQVPSTGTYQIEAYGAQGGGDSQTGSRAGGRGARMTGEFNLNQGDILRIIAGQTGLITGTGGGTGNRGGGGGSFIWNVNGNALLLAAGGGGGTNVSTTNTVGNDAVVGLNGTVLSHGGGSPGTNGNGGNPGAAGWLTNGSNIQGTAVPLRPLNGGVGGQGYNDQASHDGGFGGGQGGGGNPSTTQASGGGGGYSGGAGQTTPAGFGGGGGGSYNSGLNQNNASGINTGHGYVVITSPSGALCMSNLVPVTVTVITLPDPVASDATINCGETATLTASGSPADYTWYSDAGGINVVGTGSTFVSPMLNDDITYYVASTSGPSCSSNLIPVQVSVIPLPDPVASNATINCGESATLTASGSPHEYTWYSDAGGTTVVATGSVFTTPLLATDMTYYVASTYAGMCVSNLIPVAVTVIPLYDPVATDATINCGETATLTASGSQAGYTWYSDAAGTQVVGTGSTYVTPMLNDNATYYVASTSGSLCISNLIPSHVTVIPLPDPSSNDTTIYCGATVTLTATGSPAEYTWYSDAGATTEIGTGPQFTTPALSDTTTYYVASTSGASGSGQTLTFTNCGATGRFGPTQSQVNSTYSGTNLDGQVTVNPQGVQLWTVPVTGVYTIETWGAEGGNPGPTPGKGARMKGDFTLTQGQQLAILVGQQGGIKSSGCNAGGGGGTFVWDPTSTSEPLIVAGGGGGGGGGCGTVGLDAGTGTSGGSSGSGATPGTGGFGATPGGAGWKSNGGTGLDNANNGNLRPLAGGVGGLGNTTSVGDGGFGGGAGASGQTCSNGGPGGGGGYSGGAGPSSSTDCGTGGGGGSYNSGTNQDNTAGVKSGHGLVVITVPAGILCTSNLIPVTVNIETLPDPVASDATINCGETATLTASGSPADYTWYSDAGGINVVGTGSTFVSPMLNDDITYYVASTSGPSCSSNLIPVQVSVIPLPDPVASDATINCGENATLTASGSPHEYTWYSDAGGTTVVATGSVFTTPLLATDMTYYVASTYAGMCISNLIPVTVTVIPLYDPVATDATINCGETATLTASGSQAGYTWYSDAAGTQVVGTGSTYVTPMLNDNATYYVASTSGSLCISNLIPSHVTVIPLPDPSSNDTTIYCGATVTLTATGSPAEYTWYSDAGGTTEVGTGPQFTTPALSDTTTYYVASTSGASGSGQTLTFTNCGATGRFGPTQSQVNSTYSGTNLDGQVTVNPQGVQLWTVPVTGVYTIETWGAEGGRDENNLPGGRGARMRGEFSLTAGETISILVGQKGWDSPGPVCHHRSGAGGGGSFVWQTNNISFPLIAAGGGGAGQYCSIGSIDGRSTTGNGSGGGGSAGGAGWNGDGGNSGSGSHQSPLSILSGGTGGYSIGDPCGNSLTKLGGFGGGNANGQYNTPCAGGGGYQGGTDGEGGFSFNSGTNQSNSSGVQTGHGLVVITAPAGILCSSNLIPVTVNIETLPDPVASDATINCGETATLTASGSPADYTWYSDAGGTNVIGTGSTFVTPMLNDDITYYVASTSGPSCSSNLIPVQVSVIPLPDPVASNATINCGESATLTASGSPHEYTWYSDAGGTTVVATGSVFTTPLLATDMTYYVASTYAGMCVSNLIPVAVTVIPLYDPVATDATINCGETATLTASGSQAGYTWYSDATGTQVVGTGSTYVTPMLNDNATYYVASTSGSLCISNLIPSHVTVIPLPDPSSNDTTIYCGATVTLTATGSPAEYTWYSDAGATTEIGTGPQFTTPALSDTTTYYVASTAGASTSFIITEICHFKTPTGQPTAGWPSYLLTDDYIEITGVPGSSLGGYTLEQWDGSTMLSTHTFGSGIVLSPNGTAIIAVGQMGSSVESPSNYYYHGDGGYSTSFSSGGAAGRILKDPFGVIVDAVGYPGGTSGYSFPPSSGVTPDMWSGNVPDATSTSGIRLIGPHTSSSANWVVSSSTYPQNPNAQNSGVAMPSGGPFCSSNLIPVTVNIETLPDPVASDATINCGETATLTASGSPADYTWYSDAGGINVVGTGSTFVSPMLNDDITYYVASTSGPSCSSNLIPVQVSVIPLPDPVASNATINCGESATLTASGSPHEYTWYSDAGGTTVVATGSVFTTPLLATDMTYYVASTYAGMCVSNLIPVAVTVIPLYDPFATDATINCGETATLTASGSQAGYTWYSDATGTQVVGTGSTYVTPMLNDNTTYYVASTSGSLCISNLIPSHVTVIPLSDPSSNDTTVYCGATVTLTATGSPAEYTWYADAGGTTEVGTGPQFTTPALSDTTTYYVASTAGASTSFIITEICHYKTPTGQPTAGWPSYLLTDDYIEITGVPGSSLGGYTLEQWDGSTMLSTHTFGSGVVLSPNGTAIIAVGQMGSSVESPSNYYYHGDGGYSTSFSSGGAAGRILKDPFGVIVDAVGYPGGTSGYSFPPSSGVTPDMWSGNVPDATSTSGIRLIGPHTSSSANWVVSSSTYPQNPNAQNSGVAMPSGGPFCSSNLIPVTVNIETLPDPVASDATINCGETATLTASGSPADYTWYSDAGGINVVGTGSTFVSPMLNDDITYYVASTSGPSCSSNLIPVQVSVIPLPDPVASNATINCGESATLTASGSPHEYTWYSDAGGTTVVATGSVFTTPLLATDMTYYVASTYAGMCVSNLIPVAVTVIPLYDPVATDATINCGETATLTASGSQAGYTWYSDATGTQVVGTGSTYVTPMLNDNTTYYVASTSGSLCISNLIPSHVTVIPLSDPSSNDTTVYCGATVTLTATGSPAEYTWYADAGGTTEVGTGPQFTTPALSDTTTYYVASTAGASTSFIITEICQWRNSSVGNPTGGWPSYLIADDYIEITGVPGSSLGGYTLEQWDATSIVSSHTFGSGVVLSPSGTAIIAVGEMGSSSESPSNYYYHGNGGFSSSFSSGGGNGRILKDPFGLIIDAVAYPGSGTYAFPPSAGVTPDMWSGNVSPAGSTSGIRLIGPHTSSSANWVVSSSTYPQNPNAQNAGVAMPSGGPFCSSNLIPVTVNIETLPDPVASDATINCGETATLTASGSPADYTWYSDAGGINVVGTGSTFVSPMLNDDITYYVASTSGPSCSSNLIPVQVSVIPLPDPVASNATINCGESATLTASGSPHEYTWYSDAGGTTVVATGSVFTTPLLATDMTYYVASTYAGMCVSNLIPVAVTVIPLYDPFATDATINCGETATLTASGSQAGYTWYSDATGTQVVGTGSTYVTPMLNDNTTYYVASTSGSLCISNLIPSHVTVIPLSDPSSNDTTVYCGATVTLTATGSPAEYTWYADAGGTTEVGTGPQFTTPALSDTTTYYVASTAGASTSFIITEICHYKTPTGQPTAGWPSYLLTDDYIEITGVPGSSLGGYTLEQWDGSTMLSTHTFGSGVVLSPNGTAIIAVGQMGSSVESPSNYYYHGDGGYSTSFSSGGAAGRILKDPFGVIVDAVGYPGGTSGYSFPPSSGVTPDMWSGNVPDATSTSGIRLIGPHTSSSANWVVSSSTYPQNPNAQNSGVAMPSGGPFCSSNLIPVTVTIQVLPDPVASDATINCGETATLTASGSPADYTWYSDAGGTNVIGTGSTFVTPMLNDDITYYVASTSGPSCSSNLIPVQVSVIPLPDPVASDATINCGETATLTASGSPSDYMWFEDAGGTIILGTGSSLDVTPNTTSTYYVASSSGGMGSGQTLTFTNCGATGRFGPTQSQVNSTYSGTDLDGQITVNPQGVQLWTVPVTGVYTIETWGAEGGNPGQTPGRGARMKGDFTLTQGQQLAILVGQQGGVKNSGCNAGGGGGTFVWDPTSTSEPMIVAGGGGGGGGGCGTVGLDAGTGTSGGSFGSGATPGTGGFGATPGGAGWKSNGGTGLDNANNGNLRPLAGVLED